jgi:4-hydroxybenzoate polyprenyltransferase
MVDREDDLKIGMKTSAITLGRWDVPAVMAFYAIYIVIFTVILAFQTVEPAQAAILFIVFFVALTQAVWHYTLIRTRSREGCFAAFRANHWLGFTFFAGFVAVYALQA